MEDPERSNEDRTTSETARPGQWWLEFVDLSVCLLLTVLVALSLEIRQLRIQPLLYTIGFLFVLFVPGYALVAGLFPTAASIDSLERLVFSVGTSVAIVGFVVTILGVSGSVSRSTVILGLGSVTFVLIGIAAVRRLAADEASDITAAAAPAGTDMGQDSSSASGRSHSLMGTLTLGLLLVVSLLAIGSIGFAVSNPVPDERFTELYLLDASGESTANPIANRVNANDTTVETVVIGVDNHEHRRQQYFLVVQRQYIRLSESDIVIQDRTTMARYNPTLSHGETWRSTYKLEPVTSNRSIRIAVFLYDSTPPTTATSATAVESVHLWVHRNETES